MPFPLHKAPQGLLGAFDLKTLGGQPREFGDLLMPTVDLRAFYRMPNHASRFSTFANPTLGSQVSLEPVGEIWDLACFDVSLVRVAADAALTIEVDLQVGRSSAAGNPNVTVHRALFGAVPATDLVQSDGFLFPEQLLLKPGERLRVTCRSTMTAGGFMTIAALFSAYPL